MGGIMSAAETPGQPDAEDAKVTQRTQKGIHSTRCFLRPLRNLCVLCVRLFHCRSCTQTAHQSNSAYAVQPTFAP
jgi:hypothetical protein